MMLNASPACTMVTDSTAARNGIDIARHHRVEGEDQLGGNQHHVHRLVRQGGVAARALERDVELVGRRHDAAGPRGEAADRQAGQIVQAVDLLDAETLHQAVFDHSPAAGAALLGRLEDQHRGAGEWRVSAR